MALSGHYKLVYDALETLDQGAGIGEGQSAGTVYREGIKSEGDSRVFSGEAFPNKQRTRQILDILVDREKIYRVVGADDEKGSVIVGRYTTGNWGEF